MLQSGALEQDWCAGPSRDPIFGVNTKLVDPAYHWYCGIGLGATPDGYALIELGDSYADLKPVIARYRRYPAHMYFPYPHDLLSSATAVSDAKTRAYLKMEFGRDCLDRFPRLDAVNSVCAAAMRNNTLKRHFGLLSIIIA
ncbi:MAG TPA: hypothetical protein VMU16_02320 [Candidatus Binataceae bacterium]|nr:hypothetical protein [Candidatus Binataceae bacterium]